MELMETSALIFFNTQSTEHSFIFVLGGFSKWFI
nr:MAG TPA: hypothetical protein [Caudoviricetes sp.]